jgi:hypothetical protein
MAYASVSEESPPMSGLPKICRYCVSDGVPRRSFWVALIVGTILNLINQGDALLGHAPLSLAKIILTFAVPYCVATYGAVSFRLSVMQAPHRDS